MVRIARFARVLSRLPGIAQRRRLEVAFSFPILWQVTVLWLFPGWLGVSVTLFDAFLKLLAFSEKRNKFLQLKHIVQINLGRVGASGVTCSFFKLYFLD